MTNAMTSPVSARCSCGQPWEAHDVRCPPKRRGVGRLVALAVAGGLAAVFLFVVVALGLVGRSPQFTTVTGWTSNGDGRRYDQAQEACVMFNRWVPTAGYNGRINKTPPGDVRLLRRAITLVGQSRRLRPHSVQRLNLQTYLTVLPHRAQQDSRPNDFVAVVLRAGDRQRLFPDRLRAKLRSGCRGRPVISGSLWLPIR